MTTLSLAPGIGGLRTFLQKERHWLYLAVPYLLAWSLPMYWLGVRLGLAAQSGTSQWWGNSGSPLLWQLFVPIGFGLLIFARRDFLLERLRNLERQYAEHPQRRRGGDGLVMIACLALVICYLVQVPGAAVVALLFLLVALVRRIYSQAMLPALASAFAFLLLMIPPPDSAVALLNQKIVLRGSIFVAALILSALGKGASADNFVFLRTAAGTIEIDSAVSGLCVALPLAVFALLMGMYFHPQRSKGGKVLAARNIRQTTGLMAFGFFVGILVGVCRLVLAGLTVSSAPGFSHFLNTATPWLIILPLSYLLLLLNRRLWSATLQWEAAAGRALRPVGDAVDTAFRPLERAAVQGEKAIYRGGDAVGKGIGFVFAPLVRGMDRFFEALGKAGKNSNRQIEKALARLGGKGKKRGSRRR